MTHYIFLIPESHLWTCWQCLLDVMKHTIIVVDSKKYHVSMKTPFSDVKKTKLWPSVALQIWLVIYFYYQQEICGLTGKVCLMFLTVH